MRVRARIPRVITSTLEVGPSKFGPVLDGQRAPVENVWGLPPGGVALVGRPAVWYSLDVSTPRIGLGPVALPPLRLCVEEDFGGHLFLVVAEPNGEGVRLLEAGPSKSDGTGALLPYSYPEIDFVKRGEFDFDPVAVEPPHGLSAQGFARMLLEAERAYDGDQRYLAVEIPFLRVGRDSNSYASGLLLACGVDPRTIPKPAKTLHHEWIGYPGVEDPVHRANFGAYLGAPSDLGDGTLAAAYHGPDGEVRYVALGGRPDGIAHLPDGSERRLDPGGRCVLEPAEARRSGLPVRHTEPPEQLRRRRHFPSDPSPFGQEITLIVAGRSVPLRPGDEYRGTIVARNDALALATLYDGAREIVLPLVELGVELRDPARTDRLLHVGNELTVGLHEDRRPKLIAHGAAAASDAGPARTHTAGPDPRLARRESSRGFAAGAAGGLAAAAVQRLFRWRSGTARPAAVTSWLGSALLGGVYGMLVERIPALSSGRGALLGFALCLRDALKRRSLPSLDGRSRFGAVAARVVWGVVLESARRALRTRAAGSPRGLSQSVLLLYAGKPTHDGLAGENPGQ